MTQRVEAGLSDLRRYLQGEIPPSFAADGLATLMMQPPDVLMQCVAVWAAEEVRLRGTSPRELLLHAMKKIYIMGELQLFDRDAVASYLDRATGIALRVCPEPDRDQLRADLTAMRRSRDATDDALP